MNRGGAHDPARVRAQAELDAPAVLATLEQNILAVTMALSRRQPSLALEQLPHTPGIDLCDECAEPSAGRYTIGRYTLCRRCASRRLNARAAATAPLLSHP